MLEFEARSWKHDNYLVSTEWKLLQIDEISTAFHSDLMWWARGLPTEVIEKALRNSLCLGLYESAPAESEDSNGTQSMKQIGLARMVTDDVTFAYLTDVYILPEYQGKGLGQWLMECLGDTIKNWPYLRRFMFLTSDTMDFYRKTIGAKEWHEFENGALKIGMILGPAVSHTH